MAGTSYWDYLHLDQLLGAQGGVDGTNVSSDELTFIVVHQVFELWFVIGLREVRLARDTLASNHVDETSIPTVVHHLRRLGEVLRQGVAHFDLVETLAPQDFLAFRDKLFPASGFQSFQMRELEALLGLDDAQRVAGGPADPIQHILDAAGNTPAGRLAISRIRALATEGTLHAALDAWLHRTPIDGSSPSDAQDEACVDAFVDRWLGAFDAHLHRTEEHLASTRGPDASIAARFASARASARTFLHATDVQEASRARRSRVRAAVLFIESYRHLPLLAWPRLLLDTLVETEEQLVLWRNRHARMVERVIGRRIGTGGSGGVEYLDRTATLRIFHDLWTVRTLLLPAEANPALLHADAYGFSKG